MFNSELSLPPSDIESSKPARNSRRDRAENQPSVTSNGKRRAENNLPSLAARTKRQRPNYKEADSDEDRQAAVRKRSPKKGRSTPKQKTEPKAEEASDFEESVQEDDREQQANGSSKKARTPKATPKKVVVVKEVKVKVETKSNGVAVAKVVRKRKTKEEKEAEMQPLAARTVGSKLLVGAHVSAAGGRRSSHELHRPATNICRRP